MFCQLGLCTIELAGNMSQVSQNILLHARRVKFIDGGARKSDPDDCDVDNSQCCFSFFSSCGCILDRGMDLRSCMASSYTKFQFV